jgi:phosphate uptake regulator
MKTRKLQQVGGGTYTVSIPKEWADAHALEAGMELNLYAHSDGSIVVRTEERDGGDLSTVRIDVSGETPELVERALRAAHAVGFETVTLVPDGAFTPAQRRAARSVVRDLVGTDLLAERAEEITVQHLLDASTVSVRQSVVQLQFTALSVHREATAVALDGDGEVRADQIRERAAEAERLARMVHRHAARSLTSFEELDRLGVSRTDLFDYEATARALARVADEAVHTAEAAEGLSTPLPEPVAATVREAADDARTVVDEATTAVLDGPDAAAAHLALDRRDETVGTVTAATDALFDASATPFDGAVVGATDGGRAQSHHESVATAAAAGRVLDAVRRTAACGGTVAEVALRAAVRADDH